MATERGYLNWLAEETPTRWWHDSGDPGELRRGLGRGPVRTSSGCRRRTRYELVDNDDREDRPGHAQGEEDHAVGCQAEEMIVFSPRNHPVDGRRQGERADNRRESSHDTGWHCHRLGLPTHREPRRSLASSRPGSVLADAQRSLEGADGNLEITGFHDPLLIRVKHCEVLGLQGEGHRLLLVRLQ